MFCDQNVGFRQNVLFETKCALWAECAILNKMCYFKQNVLFDQNVIFRQNVLFWNKICFIKCVMWILCGKYCIVICELPVNAWYNFWIHTRVIVMHTGVHAMMTLKCLRMRHAYDNDMQTNICNAFCIVLCAWKCNDAFVIVFRLGDVLFKTKCGF